MSSKSSFLEEWYWYRHNTITMIISKRSHKSVVLFLCFSVDVAPDQGDNIFKDINFSHVVIWLKTA